MSACAHANLTLAHLQEKAEDLVKLCAENGMRLACAESCTGGLLAMVVTAVEGASEVFDRGYVTYANAAKTQDLGIDARLIANEGAVSEAVARAMALETRKRAHVDLAAAITGIAGPGGGSLQKPVGLVYLGLATSDQKVTVERLLFSGDRRAVRFQAASAALDRLLACVVHA